MNDVQAGLKDFDYMGNMESIDELKKQIAVTGAEVNKNSFHEPKPYLDHHHLHHCDLGKPLFGSLIWLDQWSPPPSKERRKDNPADIVFGSLVVFFIMIIAIMSILIIYDH